MAEVINKIIYFDRETIRNILQEQNKGSKVTSLGTASSMKGEAEIGAEAKIGLGIPLIKRFSFLFTGKIRAEYIIKRDKETTITSTDISMFESIKDKFENFSKIKVSDIENSSTFFSVASNYSRVIKGGVEGVEVKEFKSVIDGYNGYDIYKIDDNTYVRFNNSAFVSNYKRNDLLTTIMDLFCIKVGDFNRNEFNYIEQIERMSKLYTGPNPNQLLAEIYPPKEHKRNTTNSKAEISEDKVTLFDVVYACVSSEAQE